MTRGFKFIFLLSSAAWLASGCGNGGSKYAVSPAVIDAIEITSLPETLDSACRNGKAKLYDECSDQLVLFETALQRAKLEGKAALVSYGAEWCIWCHVFKAYIEGDIERFTYRFGEPRKDKRYTHTMYERAPQDVSQQAYDLKTFVSETYVVVHIDYEHSPDGDDVLSRAKAWDNFDGGVPYIFSVDADGHFVRAFNSGFAEIRRDTDDWYRGYDRIKLLEELKAMYPSFK